MSTVNGLPPIRLCCGERHWGVVCLDGKVMCCMCFERVEQKDLYGDQDVCIWCAEKEGLEDEEADNSDAES
jgi:hypothetical protein